jgi:hypothetical protein
MAKPRPHQAPPQSRVFHGQAGQGLLLNQMDPEQQKKQALDQMEQMIERELLFRDHVAAGILAKFSMAHDNNDSMEAQAKDALLQAAHFCVAAGRGPSVEWYSKWNPRYQPWFTTVESASEEKARLEKEAATNGPGTTE